MSGKIAGRVSYPAKSAESVATGLFTNIANSYKMNLTNGK